MYVIQCMVFEADCYTILFFMRLQSQSIALDTVIPVDIDMEKDIDMERYAETISESDCDTTVASVVKVIGSGSIQQSWLVSSMAGSGLFRLCS